MLKLLPKPQSTCCMIVAKLIFFVSENENKNENYFYRCMFLNFVGTFILMLAIFHMLCQSASVSKALTECSFKL